MRSQFVDQAPEVQQQSALVAELASQVRKLEAAQPDRQDGEYLNSYRDFKYQEALFEQFSRQLELARVDEGREGGLLQVV
ncbi:MAG: lipopolysaccharide biosynthesis protein, partial [bacterium]